jgi:hypothetical protein
MSEDEETSGGNPYFEHHLVGGQPVDPETWRDVARFRRAERTRLLAKRKLPTSDRQAATSSLIRALAMSFRSSPATHLRSVGRSRGSLICAPG